MSDADWWLITASRKYKLWRDGKWSERTKAEYIESTGDTCGGAPGGCNHCRIVSAAPVVQR